MTALLQSGIINLGSFHRHFVWEHKSYENLKNKDIGISRKINNAIINKKYGCTIIYQLKHFVTISRS